MARYDIVDFQSLEGPVKKVRKALGARAFGVNFFDLPPGSEGHEHDETERDHEEVYVYVRGSGTLRLDGEELKVREGLAVRVDPRSGDNRLRATTAWLGWRLAPRATGATSRPRGDSEAS